MLRMASPSLQVLREDRDSMRAELYKMKPLYRSVADLEAENAILKKERLEWTQYFDQETEDKKDNDSSPKDPFVLLGPSLDHANGITTDTECICDTV